MSVEHGCQVCLMIEAMADGGVKMGLSRDTALKLAAHTLMVFILLVLRGLLHCTQYKTVW